MENSITEILTNIHGIKTILMREIKTLEINDYIKANPSWFLINNDFTLNDKKPLEVNLLAMIKNLKPACKDKEIFHHTLTMQFDSCQLPTT